MPHLSKAVYLVLFIGLGGGAGCGGPTRSTPLPTVQGQWQGAITSAADGIGTVVITLNQSGTVVTGSVVLSAGTCRRARDVQRHARHRRGRHGAEVHDVLRLRRRLHRHLRRIA